MNGLEIIEKIWRFYLNIRGTSGLSKNKDILVKEINSAFPNINENFISDSKSSKGKVLIIYASQRMLPFQMMNKAINNLQKLGYKSDLDPILVDVHHKKLIPSEMTFLMLKMILYVNLRSVKFAFKGRYLASVATCIGKWFSKNEIELICLFSSNSRLIEIFRLCGIKDNIQLIEFLHGSPSETFTEYFDLLEAFSDRNKVGQKFINMCPGMPQPNSISSNILHYKNKEIFFRNEKIWRKPQKKIYDVLIVGDNTNKGNFVDTHHFESEVKVMEDLIENNLSVVYCSHPRTEHLIDKNKLPEGVAISRLYKEANSAKILVGGDSAGILSAHLLGKRVLIYPESWKMLSSRKINIFQDIENHTYTLERLLEMIKGNGSSENIQAIENNSYLDIMEL